MRRIPDEQTPSKIRLANVNADVRVLSGYKQK